jgi:D-serine deaminase-like pyridoxal phosphate-dependent protein
MSDLIGLPIQDLDTPSLLLDHALMNQNLRRMASFFRDLPAKLRPHFKNHKCTRLARLQMAAGSAVGMTCAKLGEAEVLADAGIADILIANQIVGPAKLQRLIELARRTSLRVAVDDITQARAISEAAATEGAIVGLLIEVDIGMGRCGVAPREPALRLAREISALPGVRFDGLQAYEGHLVSVADVDERRRRVREAMQPALETRQLIEADGIEVRVISGGSTSTYSITGQIEGIDEIQAGTYPTMDWMYHALAPAFDMALSILARVISRPKPGVAVLDVGLKGIGQEFGPPKIKGELDSPAEFRLSEEHCTGRDVPDWRIGQVVELIPSHSCTSCNLHRQMIVHEQGRVIDVWSIDASGKLS